MEEQSPGAREYLEGVRDAVLELERTELQLQALKLHAQDSGNMFAPRVAASPKDIDGSAKMAAMMDRQAVLERRRQVCVNARQSVWRIAYGGPEGGLERALGPQYADVVWMRVGQALKWDSIGPSLDCTVPTVRRWYETACDYLDSVGIGNAGTEA